MQSQTPIFDRLVVEFAERNKHYIDLVGGIKPSLDGSMEDLFIEEGAKPLGWNVNDDTQVLDPVVQLFPSQFISTKDILVGSSSPVKSAEETPPPVPAEPPKRSGVYPRRKKKDTHDTASQTETSPSPDDSA